MTNQTKPATAAFNKLRELHNNPDFEDQLDTKQKIIEYIEAGIAAANENLDNPEELEHIIYDLEIFNNHNVNGKEYPELEEVQDDIMSFEDFIKVDKMQGTDVNDSINAWVKFSSTLADRVGRIID